MPARAKQKETAMIDIEKLQVDLARQYKRFPQRWPLEK